MTTLQFSANRTLGSRLIRAATWSDFSHVEFVLPSGRLLGAAADGGVLIRDPRTDYSRVERYRVDTQAEPIVEAAREQLCKPYDWAGVIGWGLRRDWQEDDAWFCSELVAWAFHAAGHPLLRAERLHRITPRDLLLSPLLRSA